MDFARVRATYLGVFMFYEGATNVNRSIVRIAFINVTFGTIRVMGSGMLNLVARNVRTTLQTILIPNQKTVTVAVSFTGHPTETITIGPPPSLPYQPKDTIVYVVRMDVQIASL